MEKNFLIEELIALNQRFQLSFSSGELEEFASYFELARLTKGDYLLREGQYCLHTNLVEAGLFMYYQIVDGEEVARDFAIEHDWVSYIKSFNQNIPSDMNIRALENATVHRLSKSSIHELTQKNPQILALKAMLVEASFMEVTDYNISLNSTSAEDHYKKLIDTRPQWIQRVPQYYIASYMGIKPQSLSRIRKKMSWD